MEQIDTPAARGAVMTKLPIRLVPLRELDLSQIAGVHRSAFPKSLLTRIGTGAVRRYYHWQMTGPHQCIALGAWEEDELCGFCFGGRFNGALQGFLRVNRWYLIACLGLKFWLLTDPVCRARVRTAVLSLLGKFRKRAGPLIHRQDKQPPRSKIACGNFGILSIAILPSAKRRGIGRLFIAECEKTAKAWGARKMGLTVSTDNAEAIKFYEALGWQRSLENDQWKGAMTKSLEGPGEMPGQF